MKTELKEIRERLQNAINTEDWWVVKSQMNKLDTIIYNESKTKIEISHVMPNGNIWLSIDGTNLIEIIECHNLYPAKKIADLIINNSKTAEEAIKKNTTAIQQ